MPIRAFALCLLAWVASAAWVPADGGTQESFRGISTVNSQAAWVSGTKGTLLHTRDGGTHWTLTTIDPSLDFRDVEAATPDTPWLLASGPGSRSRLYRLDHGAWQLALTNPDAQGFFDAIAFFDRKHGILLGDPVDGRFVIYTSRNGEWTRAAGPAALPGEGAFAASGTCLVARSNGEAWFGTGAARVFHTTDFGLSWNVSQTPLIKGQSAGVFSLAFSDRLHGIAVGGDYTKPTETTGTAAFTADGGLTWHAAQAPPAGYRSAVAFRSASEAIATGPSGSDVSHDGGRTWQPLSSPGYHTLSFRNHAGWAAGSEGRIAKWR